MFPEPDARGEPAREGIKALFWLRQDDAIPAMTGAADTRNREEATQPNGWRDQQAIQDAIGALKYAYRNVSSITAEKVKSEIIPKLEGLVALPPPPPSQESEG